MSVILIPMAGEGSRFQKGGYTTSKPMIPVTDRRTGEKVPMVVAASLDVPGVFDESTQVVYVDRDFHRESGFQEEIRRYIPKSDFITVGSLTKGQADTCMRAREYINNDGELFIGACDNGMVFDADLFEKVKNSSDVIIVTHSGDSNIERNPLAHSWISVAPGGIEAKEISIKKTVSEDPMKDYATTGMFWFKRGSDFVKSVDRLMVEQRTYNNEYYVDAAIQVAIESGLAVNIFNVRYLCWGTPEDYEEYEKTIAYWREFVKEEDWV